MTSDTYESVEQAVDELDEQLDMPREEIEQQIEEYLAFDVPLREAVEGVRPSDSNGVPEENEEVLVGDIDEGEQWVDVEVKVVELFEDTADALAQKGVVGDESGTTIFSNFNGSLPTLEEGDTVRIEGAVTDEWNGRHSIKLVESNKDGGSTQVEFLDEDIEVGDDTETVTGTITKIQDGSGLIKRCPEEDCSRTLSNGRCAEHGEVDGEFDLRIKAYFNLASADGGVLELIFNQERTAALTGISLEEAQEQAMDALDTSVVADRMRDLVVGTHLEVTYEEIGRYALVREFDPVAQDEAEVAEEVNAALAEARAMV